MHLGADGPDGAGAGCSLTVLMMYSVRAAVVGGLHDVPRHFGMHDDADAGCCSRTRCDLRRA